MPSCVVFVFVLCMMNSNSSAMWIMIHLNQSTNKNQKNNETNSIYQLFLLFNFIYRRSTAWYTYSTNRRQSTAHTGPYKWYARLFATKSKSATTCHGPWGEYFIKLNIFHDRQDKQEKRERVKNILPCVTFVQWSWIFHCVLLHVKSVQRYFASDAGSFRNNCYCNRLSMKNKKTDLFFNRRKLHLNFKYA